MYAYNIINPISGVFIFSITALFFLASYLILVNKTKSTVVAQIQIICYSIPLSWRNIFGGEYGELPITWFYLLGAIFAVYLICLRKEVIISKNQSGLVLALTIVLIYNFIPLILTPLNYISSGVSQFIILTFHHLLLLIVILKGRVLEHENLRYIEHTYVKVGMLTSIGILTQFFLYQYGITIGEIDYYLNRESFRFLFSDVSHSSLYLITCAFLAVLLLNKTHSKIQLYSSIFLILTAAAVTSARTGLTVFFILFILFVLLKQKGLIKQVLTAVFGTIAGIVALSFFRLVRPSQQDFNDITSGRDEGYLKAIDLVFDKPFLGYGFSKEYIVDLTNEPIPHFSFLQYIVHGGIPYALLIFGIIVYILFYALKNSPNQSWLILGILIGTSLIPDIFSARYVTVIMIIIFMTKPIEKRILGES